MRANTKLALLQRDGRAAIVRRDAPPEQPRQPARPGEVPRTDALRPKEISTPEKTWGRPAGV
jgi:hypothetical protein